MSLRDYVKLAISENKGQIRRYLVLGAFDGLVVSLSIILAISSAVSLRDLMTAVTSGLIGVSVSSFWNTIVAESREKELELKLLEKQMLRSLKGTIYEKSAKASVLIASIIHAISPLMGFLNVLAYVLSRSPIIAGAVGVLLISTLGLIYEGDLREKTKSVVIMTAAGLITAALAVITGH